MLQQEHHTNDQSLEASRVTEASAKIHYQFAEMGVLDLDRLDFSAPSETHSFDGLLFDFDGTVVDSTDAIVRHWHQSVLQSVGSDHH